MLGIYDLPIRYRDRLNFKRFKFLATLKLILRSELNFSSSTSARILEEIQDIPKRSSRCKHVTIPLRSSFEKCSCQHETYHNPIAGTFPVAPVSQALIIIFTTRIQVFPAHCTVPRGVSRVCVCNSIQSHLLTPARLLLHYVWTTYLAYQPIVLLLLWRYTRDVYFTFYVCFLMESTEILKSIEPVVLLTFHWLCSRFGRNFDRRNWKMICPNQPKIIVYTYYYYIFVQEISRL